MNSRAFHRFSKREYLPLLRGMAILPGVKRKFYGIENQGWFKAMRESWQRGEKHSFSHPFLHIDTGQGQLDFNQ